MILLLTLSCSKHGEKISLLSSNDLTWDATGSDVLKKLTVKGNTLDPFLEYAGTEKIANLDYSYAFFSFNEEEFKNKNSLEKLEIENILFRSPSYSKAKDAELAFNQAIKALGSNNQQKECEERSVYTWILPNGEAVIAALDKGKNSQSWGWLIRAYNPHKKLSSEDLYKTFSECN